MSRRVKVWLTEKGSRPRDVLKFKSPRYFSGRYVNTPSDFKGSIAYTVKRVYDRMRYPDSRLSAIGHAEARFYPCRARKAWMFKQ